MPIAYPQVLSLESDPEPVSWGERDVLLYALALGFGADPLDAGDLSFVYEKALRVMPTFAAILCFRGLPDLRAIGVDYSQVVHGEQSLTLHRPIPVSGHAVKQGRITEVFDKGAKGAVLMTRTELRMRGSGDLIATSDGAVFARGDGGFGGPTSSPPPPEPPPSRPPDVRVELPTRPDQALLYRLCGDENPLHVDPEVARAAGFERPILHGLCTYGMTCRALLRGFGIAPEMIIRHAARFSAPVYPGETLAVDFWREADAICFEAITLERGLTVIRNGRSTVREAV